MKSHAFSGRGFGGAGLNWGGVPGRVGRSALVHWRLNRGDVGLPAGWVRQSSGANQQGEKKPSTRLVPPGKAGLRAAQPQ